MSAPQVGSILGERYVLLGRVVEAPGYVEYRARDREVEVEIALWWLEPALFADPTRRAAVVGAGVELRALRDPALRGCLGVGHGTGGLWTTWQLATGPGPFAGVPARNAPPPPLDDVRRWIDAACAGVAALHREGFVHGRLTGFDVVSIGGVLKLGGGGLWRDVDPRAAQTVWAAQAHALAPELRAGTPATEAADVWSIAAIALEQLAGVPGGVPECARTAARRHPSLAAVLVGAMSPDPDRRPEPRALAEAASNATSQPYLEAPRGKAPTHGGAGATIQGHASPSADTPRRTAARAAITPDAPATRTAPGAPPRPGAFSPAPASFALPTPAVAPLAPRQTAPAVAVQVPREPPPAGVRRGTLPPPVPQRGAGTTAPHLAVAAEARPIALPTPARTAIAGAIDRARTAPPGQFVLAAVSLKPGGAQERTGPQPIVDLAGEPTGETPHLVKPKLRGIAESAPGGRSFSTAPGQLGYLAPPKAVSDRRRDARRRWVLLMVVLIVVAIGGGVTIGLLL